MDDFLADPVAAEAPSWSTLPSTDDALHLDLPAPGPAAELRDLLRPESAASTFVGRGAELAELQDWLQDGPVFRCVTGRPGIGKTRLALELCRWALQAGWDAGFATPGSLRTFSAGRGWERGPVLAVVDAASKSSEPLVALARTFGPSERRLRVLMVDRTSGWKDQLSAAPAMMLSGLRDPADRLLLLREALQFGTRFARGPCLRASASAVLHRDEPLHLLLAGLLAPRLGMDEALSQPVSRLTESIIAVEWERLHRIAWLAGVDRALMRHTAACITLQGGCGALQAEWLVAEEAEALGLGLSCGAAHAADVLADALMHTDSDWLAPIGPEVVGEAFVQIEFARHAPAVRTSIAERAKRRAARG